MTHTLSGYINTMLENVQDEQIEKWYLAGGGENKTFAEYKEEILSKQTSEVTPCKTGDTLKDSLKILNMRVQNEAI